MHFKYLFTTPKCSHSNQTARNHGSSAVQEKQGSISTSCTQVGIDPFGSAMIRRLISTQQRQLSNPISQASLKETQTALPNGPRGILNLPREILLHILSHILVNFQGTVTLRSSNDRRWRKELHSLVATTWEQSISNLDFRKDPAIPDRRVDKSPLLDVLLVCRHFYFAGIAAFFGDNLLHFDNIRHLDVPTKKLDMDRRGCICKVTIDHKNYAPSTRLEPGYRTPAENGALIGQVFEKLPSLKSATLVCRTSYSLHQSGFASVRDKVVTQLEDVREACHFKADVIKFRVVGRDEN